MSNTSGGASCPDPYTGELAGWMALPLPAKPESIVTVLGDGVPAPCAPPGVAIIRIVDEDDPRPAA